MNGTEQTGSNGGGIALILVIALIALVFILVKEMKKSGRKKKEKKNLGYQFQDSFELIGGLNLPEHTVCVASCYPDRITFSANGQEFNLPAEKLINVSVMNRTEIQKHYVSSAGGAVAGAILLGPVGAMIGGSAKKKTIKTNGRFLIFTYQGVDETKCIVFVVERKNERTAERFQMQFKFLEKEPNVHVDL